MSTAIDTEGLDLDLDLQSFENSDAGESAQLQPPAVKFDRLNILLAHEDPERGNATKALFKQAPWPAHCHRVSSIEDLTDSLQDQPWDLIIAYANSTLFLPAVVGNQIKQANGNIRAIFLDDTYSATNALQIIQCGFHDYLTEQEPERLLFAAGREAEALSHERKAMSSESVLAEAQAKSKLLLDSTADAIAYVADGMVIHANNVFVDTLGFASFEDIELQPFIDLVAADDQSSIRKIIKQLAAGEQNLPDKTLTLLDASQNKLPVQIAFANASHDGEACTQIIFHGQQGAQTSPAGVEAAATPASPGSTAQPGSLHNTGLSAIEQLAGKGMIYFVSLCNVGSLRKAIEFGQHAALLNTVQEKLREISPATALVANYAGENWVVAIPETETRADTTLGAEICKSIDQLLCSATGVNAANYTAVGISKYGVAEMSAQAAIEKAFTVCAAQLTNGGFKVFAPRIDNAQGSAALRSAMELDRLKMKYQPIIGLHNQSTQWYEAFVFMRNDAGIEQDASELVESLGIEKDNVALDQWLVNESITALSAMVFDNPNVSLTIPLTSSAIADNNFADWLLTTMQASNLPKDCLTFSITAEQGQDYEQQCKFLLTKLLENGFKTTITDVTTEQLPVVKACKPDFVQLHSSFTEKLNTEEDNSKEALKSAISQASEMGAVCIATAVHTAADLAQLWQTGIPYVQGSYLQAPLTSMSYEFSDIA